MSIQIENVEHLQVVVVIVPLPAQGHLNQLLHLSHLITSYGIPVHYAGSTSHNRQAKLRLHGWNSETLTKIHFNDFELPPFDSPPPKIDDPFPHHVQPLLEVVMHFRQPMFQLMEQLSMKYNRVVIIYDNTMSYIVQDVKLIPNGEAYAFLPICAFTYFSMLWESMPEEAKPFQVDPNYIPDCIPSEEGCTPKKMIEFLENFNKSSGFEVGWLYNISRVIDGKYVELLGKMISSKKGNDVKNFALGPLNQVNIQSTSKNRHQSLEWLDEQEKDSVLYVSFRTMTSLKNDQIVELALGLERCGEKFVWVLRQADPNDVFAEAQKVKLLQLPDNFKQRVKDRGIVVKDWAPQLEILAHPSVGGFMSHCGWNSCLESITMGVPIAACPMHSDQPKNAFYISNVLKIGVIVRDWELHGEIVKSITIEHAVKTLMVSQEGKEMKNRAKELGEAVRGTITKCGVST